MRISVDISLYPLNENYVEPILTFIAKLETNPELVIKRNSLSTQVFGDYDLAVSHVMAEIKQVHQSIYLNTGKEGAAVFVCKFINGDRSQVEAES